MDLTTSPLVAMAPQSHLGRLAPLEHLEPLAMDVQHLHVWAMLACSAHSGTIHHSTHISHPCNNTQPQKQAHAIALHPQFLETIFPTA